MIHTYTDVYMYIYILYDCVFSELLLCIIQSYIKIIYMSSYGWAKALCQNMSLGATHCYATPLRRFKQL